jgi:hypothetical protein
MSVDNHDLDLHCDLWHGSRTGGDASRVNARALRDGRFRQPGAELLQRQVCFAEGTPP